MNRPTLIFAFLLTAVALFSQAQDKPADPPELVAMREEHVRSMQRVTIPVLSAYTRQLESQKALFTRIGKLEAALAVDKELKAALQQLQSATAVASNTGASMQLTIQSAIYGVIAKKKTIDVTKFLRKALETDKPTIKLDHYLAGDPAVYSTKETVVNYTINGQKKTKSFPEHYVLNFKEDLQ